MSSFSIAWLDLRERADHAARDKTLMQQLLDWIAQKNGGREIPATIVDLGSGTGSTLRAFIPLGASHFIWRLVDKDGQLLNEALKRHGKTGLVEDYQMDLNAIDELPLAHAQVVTASALFDLVSGDFIDALTQRLAQQKIAFYAALNYDGTTEWTPAHPLDNDVLAAFNRDQQSDKGFGAALGPQASAYLQEKLQAAGFNVYTRPSPWILEAKDHALVSELIQGISTAVAEGYGLDTEMLAEWKAFRLEHANKGKCVIGHKDVIALPGK